MAYTPQHPVRFVTAAALFDGHDAAINIMRRILQAQGVEVVHLGHDRSVEDVVTTAIEEDAQGIAVSSYQGGHMEYFSYMVDLLRERGAGHVRVFGGGGGVIVPEEIAELEAYGVAKIFSPEDGMRMGLEGMIESMVRACDVDPLEGKRDAGWGMGDEGDASAAPPVATAKATDKQAVARALTAVEQRAGAPSGDGADPIPQSRIPPHPSPHPAPVVGITGTGGAGKSTLTDELVRRFLNDFADVQIAVLSVDPTRRRTGGALLGDRIRMNSLYGEHRDRVYMRSFATRQAHRATSGALREAVDVCRAAGFSLVVVETAGIGQSDTEVAELVDVSLYVMTSDFGAPTQLEKIGMLDAADLVALNKFEKRGAEDALRDVKKQVQRNRGDFATPPADMPVYPTMAAQFNDPGVSRLYLALLDELGEHGFGRESTLFDAEALPALDPSELAVVPPARQRYLAEIADACRDYRAWAEAEVEMARKWGQAVGRPRPGRGVGPGGPRGPGGAARRDGRALVGQAGLPLARHPRELGRARRAVPRRRARLHRPRQGHPPAAHARDAERDEGAARGRARGPKTPASGSGTRCWKTSPAGSPSPPACSRSGARARTRRGCSPARARPSGRTSGSTSSASGCRPSGCRRRSTASRSTAAIPAAGPTSGARWARAACRSPRSTT